MTLHPRTPVPREASNLVMLHLTTLESRLTPSASPFPEVPSYEFRLGADRPPLFAALAPGGPRIVWGDVSVFLADENSRQGVSIDGVRLLLAATGERVLSESVTPAQPEGIPVDANSITRGFGLFDGATIGVGLVFDTPPPDTTEGRQSRLFLPQDLWAAIADRGTVDPYSVYVAVGDEISRARQLPRYAEVQLSGPGPWDVAGVVDEVMGRLA